jgi:hypothetical protein
MTYNQVLETIRATLSTHAMIKSIKEATPAEWLESKSQPIFPIAIYTINSGSFNVGRVQVYSLRLWFLDKSGMEREFESDVTSDQVQICADIISKLRNEANNFEISENINFNIISDKFENYLAGVEVSFDMTTYSEFDACNTPLNA